VEVVEKVTGLRDFEGKKIGTVEKRKDFSMDCCDGLEGWYPLRANFLGQSEFPEGS